MAKRLQPPSDATPSAEARPYRVLFVGTLVQESALSIGGNQPHGRFDDVLCRDGRDRPTLRGEGLGGALIRTARTLYRETDLNDLTGKEAGGSERHASLWVVQTAHPPTASETVGVRHGVGIRQETGAAADGISFDMETLARGTRWSFCLAVDTQAEGGARAAGIAAAVLREWAWGHCWLGRAVARGLGWMRLEEPTAFVLDARHARLWPNATHRDPPVTLDDFKKLFRNQTGVRTLALDEFSRLSPPALSAEWYYLEVTVRIRVGEARNSYGWDAVSVGAQDSDHIDWNGQRFLKPRGQRARPAEESFKADHPIAMVPTPQGQEPYLPGSALRGPLRHSLSRRINAGSGGLKRIRDPNARGLHAGGSPDETPDEVEALFGQPNCGAALLVQDAYLEEGRDWLAALLQHHAEDELTAGVYESAKFNRLALLRGDFEFRMILEGADRAHLEQQWAQLRPILQRAAESHLGLGGNCWRGLGWPTWSITSESLRRAGDGEPIREEKTS